MNFRRSAPCALIGVAVLVTIASAFISNRLFSDLTDSVEASRFDLMAAIVVAELRISESKALARSEMIAGFPAVREAFAKRDRARLLQECELPFKTQKQRYGVDQAMFHVPPATSFLRLNAPEKFDEDHSLATAAAIVLYAMA